MFNLTIPVNICTEPFPSTKTKRTYVWILPLTVQYTVHIEIVKFFDGFVKGFTDMAKCKGDCYMFLRSIK